MLITVRLNGAYSILLGFSPFSLVTNILCVLLIYLLYLCHLTSHVEWYLKEGRIFVSSVPSSILGTWNSAWNIVGIQKNFLNMYHVLVTCLTCLILFNTF